MGTLSRSKNIQAKVKIMKDIIEYFYEYKTIIIIIIIGVLYFVFFYKDSERMHVERVINSMSERADAICAPILASAKTKEDFARYRECYDANFK